MLQRIRLREIQVSPSTSPAIVSRKPQQPVQLEQPLQTASCKLLVLYMTGLMQLRIALLVKFGVFI